MNTRFAAIFVALYIAHQLGDYWVQTDWQARTKTNFGATGHIACALHVATYTTTLVVVLAGVAYRIDMDLSPIRVAGALAASAATHYLADRRTPLRRLALACHHSGAWLDGGGLALLDQAWHMGWLGVAALIIA